MKTTRIPQVIAIALCSGLLTAAPARAQKAGVINLKAGTYTLQDTYRISSSNVRIIGEPGTRIVLASHVNKPVIAIGTQKEFPTAADVIRNIEIRGIEIDGAMAGQDRETDPARPFIRNNGIDIRAAQNVLLENVDVHDCRSGGIVASWGSSDVQIVGCKSHANFFDGLAVYASSRVNIERCQMTDNGYAGVSIDNGLIDLTLSNCLISKNRDVGIFGRNAQRIRCIGTVVQDGGSHGVFLSHDEAGHGVFDIVFTGCHFLVNKGVAVYLASPATQSRDVAVAGSVFRANTGGALRSDGAPLAENGNVFLP